MAVFRAHTLRPRAAPGTEFNTWVTHEYEVTAGRITRIDTYTDSLAYDRHRQLQTRADETPPPRDD